MKTAPVKLNPRKVFWQCGACSHAMFKLISNELGNSLPEAGQASSLLAGGIAQKGHQCGMLWGGALASGAEAYNRKSKGGCSTEASINASKLLVESFVKRTGTVNCRDISKVDWENKLQLAIYMLKTISRGFVYSPCFNLIVKWTPEAAAAAQKGLLQDTVAAPKLSCATELLRKMGATEQQAAMVAGFAGGIGLSGNACGALGAAIWYKMLMWQQENPGKQPSMLNNQDAKKILRNFYMQTDSEMLCSKITGRKFSTAAEHSEYISGGGCSQILNSLAAL
jgi:C_GCAxxG_C_C family probable redox protein